MIDCTLSSQLYCQIIPTLYSYSLNLLSSDTYLLHISPFNLLLKSIYFQMFYKFSIFQSKCLSFYNFWTISKIIMISNSFWSILQIKLSSQNFQKIWFFSLNCFIRYSLIINLSIQMYLKPLSIMNYSLFRSCIEKFGRSPKVECR